MDKTGFKFNIRDRLRHVSYYEILTSRWVVLLLLLSVVAASGLYVFTIIQGEISLWGAVAVFSTAVAATLLLAFCFGSMYFPYIKPPVTTLEVAGEENVGKVFNAASFDLLRLVYFIAGNQSIESFWEVLLGSKDVQAILNRLQLKAEDLHNHFSSLLLPVLSWERYSQDIMDVALSMDDLYITKEHALGAFLLQPEFRSYLRERELTEEDIRFALWWSSFNRRESAFRQRWWDPENLLRFSGVGLSWASGYTLFMDQFSSIPSGNLWDLPYGHESQVDQLISALAKEKQSNVLLVGEPGVGRVGIVKEVARRVRYNRAHPALNNQRVLYIHLGELLALGGSSSEQLSVISRGLREMERAGNVIAVLDGLGSVLGSKGEERVNLTDILLPFFSSQQVRVAVIMSTDEYHARVKSNSELLRFFEIVQVPALSEKDTLKLLALSTSSWESRTGVFLPYAAIREIVNNTSSVLPHIPFPEKAFDVLEEVIVVAQGQGKEYITKEDVNNLIAQKIGIHVGKLQFGEREHLLQLDEVIHRRVVNQVQAVSALSRAMIRARAGVRSQDKPIGAFLFLGPTGVGKTEASKALAEAYFGSENYMARLDMSEFQGQDGVSRLIGSLEYPTGILTSLIADKPFTVLLLDEFEKADRSVQQLFLQVFDEGHISDARGVKYMFNHAVIIATSNAGADFIHSTVQKGPLPADFDDRLREYILEKDIFRPELVNRFDGVITFTPLSEDHLRQVAELMLKKLNKRLDKKHGITVAITPQLIDYLIEIGYDMEFGARPMARAIKNSVEYAVAEQVIRGDVEAGQSIDLSVEMLRQLKN